MYKSCKFCNAAKMKQATSSDYFVIFLVSTQGVPTSHGDCAICLSFLIALNKRAGIEILLKF